MKKKLKNILLGVFSLAAMTTTCLSAALSFNVAADAQETNVFEMVYGAGIRVSDPTGMRFKTKFSENYYEELTATNTDTQMFVSVFPYADYTKYDASGMELEGWLDSYYGEGKYINIAMDPEKFYQVAEDDCYYGNAVISNIYFNNYHREFVGVAYLRRGTAGNYTYEYTENITQEANARSVFDVASKANMDEEDHQKYGESLEKIIKNGLYGAYGVTYDKNAGTYSLNGNTYTSLDAIESVVKLEDVTLSLNNESLLLGENKQLTPVLTYFDGTVFDKEAFFEWSSSNPSVATVDENGMVKTLSEGVTTITVKGCGGLYSATCTVSVSKKAITDSTLFLVKGDAGKDVSNIGLAALDLSGKGIDLQKVEKATVGGEATDYTVDGNVITFTNPKAGTNVVVLETATEKYNLEVCFYGHSISTLAELEEWRTTQVKAYTVLLEDIDAQAQTLATTNIWKEGILDGLGHTISNFKMTTAFVYALNGSAAIKNLQLVNFVQDASAYAWGNKMGVVCNENNGGKIENVLLKGNIVNVPDSDHYGLISSTAGNNSVMKNVFANLTSDGSKNHYTGPWYKADNYTISNVAIVFNANAYNPGYSEDQIRIYSSMDEFVASVDLSKWAGWTLANGKFYMSEYSDGTITETGKSFLVKSNGSLNSTATGTATINLAELGLNIPVITSILIDGNAFGNFSYNGNTLTLNDAPGGEHVYTLMSGVNGYTVSGCVYANSISTLAELEEWRAGNVRAYTVLLEDIDAQGQTLATAGANYKEGILDGLGHTISNFTVPGGFVLSINGTGAIKNLQLVNFIQDCSPAGTGPVTFGVFGENNNGGTIENVLLKGKLINVPNADHYGFIYKAALNNSVLRNVFAEITSDGGGNHYSGPMYKDGNWTISNVAVVFNARTYNPGYSEDQIRIYSSMDEFVASVDLSKWEGWTLANGKFYMSAYKDGSIVDTDKSFFVKSNGSLNSTATGTAVVNLAELGLNVSAVTSVLIDGEEFGNFSFSGTSLTLNNAPGGEHEYTLIVDTNGNGYTLSGCIYANSISTLAELEAWRTGDVAAYTVLLKDIDAQGQTLVTTDIWREGVLDGLGHTISNFTMTTGFVCAINGSGAIKNLQLVNFTQDCSFAGTGSINFGAVCGENNGGTIENVLLKGELINVPNADHLGFIAKTAGNNSVLRNVFAEITSDGAGNHYTGPWYKDGNYTISNVAVIFNARTYNPGYTEDQIRFYSSMSDFAANVDLSKWEGWTLANGKFYMSEYTEGSIVDTEKSFLVKSNGSLTSAATGTAVVNLAELGLDIPAVTSVLIDGNVFSNFSFNGTSLTLNDAPGGEHVYTLMAGVNGYILSGCIYANSISTLAELEAWRTGDVAAYTVLLKDIDAEGQMLATTDIWREGVLDGMGHTISNFTMTTAFVYAINSSAAIKNLQLVNFIQDASAYAWENKMGVVCNENNGGKIENVLLKGNIVNVPAGDHYGLISSTAHPGSVLRNVFADLTSDGTGNHYSGPWYKDGNYTISNVSIVFNGRTYNPGYTEDQFRYYGSMAEFVANVDLSKWEGWTLANGKFYMSEYSDGTIIDTGKSFLVKSNGSLTSAETGTAVVNLADLGLNIPTVMSVLIDGEVFGAFSFNGTSLTLNNAPGGEHVYTLVVGANSYTLSGCVYANGISTLAELEAWRTGDVAAYTVLLKDIDAQGQTLATTDVWHAGILDGLGHTISNFTMTTAFVYAINSSSAIKNLQLVNFVQDASAYAWGNKMGVVCNENNGGKIENVLLKGNIVNVPAGDHYGLISSTAHPGSVLRNVFADLTSDGTGNHYSGPWYKDGNYTISNVSIVFNGRTYNPGYTEDQFRYYGSMDEFVASVDLSKWEGWTLANGKFYMSEYEDVSITETNKSFLVKSNAGQWDKTTGTATVNLAELGINLPAVTSILIDGEVFTNFSYSGTTLTLNDAPGGDHVYTLMVGGVGYSVNGCVYANGISTVAELETWRTEESYWYTVLLNDIDYNGQTLGKGVNVIGLLDGRGYTISNFTHTTGFVNWLFDSNSIIKNVSFKNVIHNVSNEAHKQYGLFGNAENTLNGTIENIYLEMSTVGGSGEHYGVLASTVTGVVRNVIVNITGSYSDAAHYIMAVNNASTLENVYGVYGSYLYKWHHNHGVEEYPTDGTYRTAQELVENNARALILGKYWKNTYDSLLMDSLTQKPQIDVEDNYIVKNGETEYVIVIEDAKAEEYSTAAMELYYLFKEATGIKLAFVSSRDVEYTSDMKFIYLGGDLAAEFDVDLNALGSQGFAIKTQGQSIFIIANPQGVLYGVYEFLHETMNFEVYTKEIYTLDVNVEDLALPEMDIMQIPDIEYRIAFSGVQYSDEVSRRRMRTQNQGDLILNGGYAHNMLDKIVPFDTYYKTNSNWFSNKTYMWDDYSDTQLCYTAGGRGTSNYNQMLQVAYENVIALIASDTNPEKIYMSLSQMDVDGKWCTCSGCQSVINTYGSNSATQILFINDLTSRVQTWLDSEQGGRKVQFLMFAYYDSIDAPTKGNLKLNDNVSVWIAPINDNYMLGVNASGNEFGKTLENWKNVTNNFAVWAYNVYFGDYLVPYNTYDQIDQMIDACVANNVNYMWVQGNWNTTQNTGFDGLKGYLIAKLMWDSTLDVTALTNDYFNAVYGAAASDMLTVYNEMKTELNRITNNGATSGVPSYTSWDLNYLKAQLDRLVAAIGKLDQSDANYQKYKDAIICESISIRYIYEVKRGKTYSTSAWGSFASETSRLGFTQKSEQDEL